MINYKLTMWDAGHTKTGGDRGAQGNGIIEQDLTREIVNYADEYCKYLNMPTKYAHCNDAATELDSLKYRVNRQKTTGADVYVAIHANSFEDTAANGTETFICAAGGESEKIAKRINSRLVELGFTDRTFGKGYKIANHYVTKNTTCPAVLVETFFLSNKKDVELFKKLGAKKIAHAIVCGLYDTNIPYDISKPTEEPKERWCVKSYAYSTKEAAEEMAQLFRDRNKYVEVYQID